MENYVVMENRPASEMLDLYALSACKINDFETFDKLLFGEDIEPDFNKFYLGDLKQRDCVMNYTIALPFIFPTTMVEYQINHYVMWGVIGMLAIEYKPTCFLEYNTGDELEFFANDCWACEYAFQYAEKTFFCDKCPIWYSQGIYQYMCETRSDIEKQGPDGINLDAYYKWCREIPGEEAREAALNLQKYLWHESPYF